MRKASLLGIRILVNLGCALALGSVSALAAVPQPARSIDLRATYATQDQPLTTQSLWTIDPDEPNPAFQRWALSRTLSLNGLRSRETPGRKGDFGVSYEAITSDAKGYVRGPGPWYLGLDHFSCEKTPDTWYGTRDGALKALETAANLWKSTLERQRMELSVALDHLSAPSEDIALKAADRIYDNWKRRTERLWRDSVYKQARAAEWQYYLSLPEVKEACHGRPRKVVAPRLRDMMEPASAPPAAPQRADEDSVIQSPEFQRTLTHAPARLWDGIYSVRASFSTGIQTLNGRFLIDSMAPSTIVSPLWLQGQGVPPAMVEVPGAPFERAIWSESAPGAGAANLGRGGGGLARRGRVDRIQFSNVALPFSDFLIYETSFFDEPANAAPCCDGILGMDALRHFTIEFLPQKPTELLVKKSDNYAREGYVWAPVVLTDTLEPWSPCTASIEKAGKSKVGKPAAGSFAPQVIWDLGSESELDLATPPSSGAAGAHWALECDGVPIASGLKPSRNANARKSTAYAGMATLGRTPFVLDLPNGRIWFPRNAAEQKVRRNHSGLIVDYLYRGGERVLLVKRIEKGSPAAALEREGLKPGLVLTRINQVESGEMDLWLVNQVLAGRDGDTVQLAWNEKGATKVVPLKLTAAATAATAKK